MHIAKHAAQTLMAFAVALFSCAAQAQAPMYGSNITLDSARKVSAAAEAEARKNNWNVVIVVVDTGGHTVMLQRLDGTNYGAVAGAIQKAQTSAAYRRPTKVFEDAVKGGSPNFAWLPGVMPLEGGLPLIMDGKIVGAIGVGGGASAQDGQVAKAGMDAIK